MDLLSRVLWARMAFRVLAWIFLAGIGIQIFFAGMGIFVGPSWWLQHKSFVHFLEALPVLMLILAFVGRLPTSLKWLTVAAFGLIGVQYATIEMRLPTVAAFHPVNAVLLFWLALTLAQRVTRQDEETPATNPVV